MSPASREGQRTRREALVGLFVIVAILALTTLVFVATDPAMLRGRYHLILLVDDAQGIRRGDAVRMRGVNVGRVRGFALTDHQVAVKIEVENEYPIPVDSHVALRGINVLGEMTAEIVPGNSNEKLKDGAVIQGMRTDGVLGQVGGIADEARGALEKLQTLLSGETVENVQASTRELTAVLRALQKLTDNLNTSAVGLVEVTNGPELERSVESLDSLSARLDDILARMERGEGSLGLLSRDDALYKNANSTMVNVNQAAVELQRLLIDVRKNPNRYIKFSLF